MMKLKDVTDDSALRAHLDWNYPNLPFHIQQKRFREDIETCWGLRKR